jgi:hypothetical protein
MHFTDLSKFTPFCLNFYASMRTHHRVVIYGHGHLNMVNEDYHQHHYISTNDMIYVVVLQ